MEGEAAPSWTRVSCAGSREAAREAVDRGNAGQSLSSEITHPRKINLSPFSYPVDIFIDIQHRIRYSIFQEKYVFISYRKGKRLGHLQHYESALATGKHLPLR